MRVYKYLLLGLLLSTGAVPLVCATEQTVQKTLVASAHDHDNDEEVVSPEVAEALQVKLNDLLPDLTLALEQELEHGVGPFDRRMYKYSLTKSKNNSLISLVRQKNHKNELAGVLIGVASLGAIFCGVLTPALWHRVQRIPILILGGLGLVLTVAVTMGGYASSAMLPILIIDHKKITIDRFASLMVNKLKSVSCTVGIPHAKQIVGKPRRLEGYPFLDQDRAHVTFYFKNGLEKQLELPAKVAMELTYVLKKLIKIMKSQRVAVQGTAGNA